MKVGLSVCAVEFKEAFHRPAAAKFLEEAKTYPNFSAMIWPTEFIRDARKFDAPC